VALALVALALGPHRIGDYYTESDFYGGYAPGALQIQAGHLDAGRYGVVGPGTRPRSRSWAGSPATCSPLRR